MATETETARPATYPELMERARALCAAEPGYGSPAYRGDPMEAVALRQAGERMVDETARRIVGEDVRLCLSALVHTLARAVYEDGGAAKLIRDEIGDEDDFAGLAMRSPDADDYRDAVPSGERVTILQRDVDGHPGEGQWEWFGPNSDAVYGDDEGEYFDTEIKAWESAFSANNWDVPGGSEIFEHWAVSTWLADQLEAQGETVNRDIAGLVIWGRATTGQAISADAVLQRIARDIVES